jgi:hypothetical protein
MADLNHYESTDYSRLTRLEEALRYEIRRVVEVNNCDLTEDLYGQSLYAMYGPGTMARIDHRVGGDSIYLWLVDDSGSGTPEVRLSVQIWSLDEAEGFLLHLEDHIQFNIARYEVRAWNEHMASQLNELILLCSLSEPEEWEHLVRNVIPERCVALRNVYIESSPVTDPS